MQRGQLVLICCASQECFDNFILLLKKWTRVAMEEGTIREKNRRSLIILTVFMFLVDVATFL